MVKPLDYKDVTMDNVSEEWRPVIGIQHYEVSNTGKIRSLDRIKQFKCRWGHSVTRNHKGTVLHGHINSDGYKAVKLGRTHGEHLVHRLVATAFIGDCPAGWTVNHKNGDKLDNRPHNLEYLTFSDNTKHAHATGLHDYTKPRRRRNALA